MTHAFNHVILGGTFDHLHSGHKYLLSQALYATHTLTIGLVAHPCPYDKSYAFSIQDYETRLSNLKSFLDTIKDKQKIDIITLTDIYGTTLTDLSIEAIFVTSATLKGATQINLKRRELGLPPLTIITVPHQRGDDGEIISSSRIRSGEINNFGLNFQRFLSQKSTWHMPESLRNTLRVPLGTKLDSLDQYEYTQNRIVFCVGDVITTTFLQSPHIPSIAIYDGLSKRQKVDHDLPSTFSLNNMPGTINFAFTNILKKSLAKHLTSDKTVFIKVIGEEDLLALPTLLLAPLESDVLYGLPNEGICLVSVSLNIKTKVMSLLSQFL